MHLKSLTMKGFKSFAQPTTLALEPGVTCVVGPNGSGKSNVVDALAWVMGEQGAKSLRGGKMEDVIFAGTATRGPLGRAEVTLTIDNADGMLPIEYSEVTIRRTLFRNGGSEYAINGDGVRLLDVQELLSDTGLGKEMHVIVGQGRLDAVLRATPEERRGFIEEAAGILKHRRRKEKTVRKLEAMEANLTRLRDLTNEVRRQLKPLSRQADIARRAQGIQAIARDAKARLLADDVVQLRAALRLATGIEQERSEERVVLQEKLTAALNRAELLAAENRGDAADGARRVVFDLESVRERIQNLNALASQRKGLLVSRLESPAFVPTVTLEAVDAARRETEALAGRAAEAEALWEATKLATQDARAALDRIDVEIQAQATRISAYDLSRSELRGAADTAASKLASVRGEVLRQRNARDAASDRLAQATKAKEELDATAVQSASDSSELDAAYKRAEAAQREAEQALDAGRTRAHERERERDALQARVQALTLATAAKDGTAALLAAGLEGVEGPVAEHLRIDEGYEAAIAAALGSTADAVLASDADAAFRVLAHATGEKLGLVEIVAELGEGRPVRAGSTTPMLPEGLRPAAALVQGPPAITALLAHVHVSETLDEARAAMAALSSPDGSAPAGAGLTVVTRAGEVLTSTSLRGGFAEEGTSRLELLAARDRASARLTVVTDELDQAALALAEHRAASQAAKAEAKRTLDALRAFDGALAAEREQLNRASARVDAGSAELARAAKAFDLASSGVEAAEQAALAAKRALAEHEALPRPELDSSARVDANAAVERAREAEVEARLQLETLRERSRSERLRADSLVRQLEADRQAADKAARETVVRRAELAQTERVLAAIPSLTAAVQASLAEAQQQLAEAERERAAQHEELGQLRQTEQQLRARLSEITEDVHSIELQIYEKKSSLRSTLERAASELRLAEAVLVAEYGPDQLVPADDDALRAKAERIASALAEQRARHEVAGEGEAAAEAEDSAAAASDADAGVREGEAADAAGQPSASSASSAAGTAADSAEHSDATAEQADSSAESSTAAQAAAAISAGAVPALAEQLDDDLAATLEGDAEEEFVGVPFVRAEQQARLAAAERKMSTLGRINPLALEEFAALEQRHAFLADQLDDLAATKADLLRIVGDIDERMRTVFEAAFEDTRAAFHTVFPILFPGGSGDITLTAPDDMLTTGIEVSVRPAGKKIERLSLLSGGERSLAAVAILVSIFKARPSPFYIMDEVEAALDDANLGRLLAVFEELRASSQLIVITHQKRTMEIADALYGVSMRQDGVSAVVGQRIHRTEDQPAA
ncbi:chromosome segregation protein SMC [Pseudoclavibacter sp. RFBG4]|uniref:AAA family ATPase n=1 Tax=Pseudoclavibacter sp. RFBG4 TaxID=2080575 RepID=UPI000CE8EC9D|nr:AAA family ATPase [Pseudoclavibacter sp. RFBG4]PPG35325.1 chromosome segregation protein SMC [Pseudoclavibacter sp. RFBG4]